MPTIPAALASALTAITCLAASLLAQPAERPTWDTLDQLIQSEIDKGFAGSVLLVRDGEVFHHAGYGLADRETQTPNSAETIFAVGSTPIDFTLVAALQLIGAGKLDFDDTIGDFFTGFDEPKRSITIQHIMESQTGLPDFHGRPSDPDPDHGPLSRDQFIQRMREAELLFKPGTDRAHSHAAWCLLAAIVEVTSGKTYEQYLQDNILEPAGMTRTGPYGVDFPDATIATGYGFRTWGDKNAPHHWGETTWLVKGSGGMVSTTGDLNRFHEAINAGKLVPASLADRFPDSGLAANGDMYGFECMFNIGGDDRFYLCTNTSNLQGGYNLEPFARALYALCTNAPIARYSIGIGIERGDHHATLSDVVPGSAADAAGLKPGDILVAANNTPFDPQDPLEALRDAIENGTTTAIKVRREGKELTLSLTPRPRNN